MKEIKSRPSVAAGRAEATGEDRIGRQEMGDCVGDSIGEGNADEAEEMDADANVRRKRQE